MIVYNANDIITKAKELADMVNSDFISYRENLSLLNEAYTQVYQKAIDHGDNLYVKEMRLDDLYQSSSSIGSNVREFCLPEDFYQLKSLTDTFNSVVPRKSKGSNMLSRCYEIRNDKLFVYGINNTSLLIEYYPIPETLYLSVPDIVLSDKDYPGFPAALYENHLILYFIESTIVTFVCYDLRLGTKREYQLHTSTVLRFTSITVEAAQDGFTISYTEEGQKKSCMVSYSMADGIIVSRPDIIPLRSILNDENTLSLVNDDFSYMSYLSYNETYWMIKDLGLTLVIEGRDLPEEDENSKVLYSFRFKTSDFSNPRIVDINDNELIILDRYKLYHLNIMTGCLTKEKHTPSFLVYSYGSTDLNTGYGRLVYKKGERAIESAYKSTELDFPNNFYYTYMSYKLAIAYKIKQNADPSLLMAQLNDAENAYYDTLRRDSNGFVRITNTRL